MTAPTLSELKRLTDDVVQILSKEGPVVEFESDEVAFVGDIHGDYESLSRVLSYWESRICWLGDYVDRGPAQIESVIALMAAKVAEPNRIITLRGNHETTSMNYYYGFYDVVRRKLGAAAYGLFASFFAQLPFCAVWNGEVVGLHGGVPEGAESVNYLKYRLRKGEEDVTDPVALQIIWNDPSEEVYEFSESQRGPGFRLFGRRVVENFLRSSNARLLIRAHEPVEGGYSVMFDGMLVTVFSCRYYGVGHSIALMRRGSGPRGVTIDSLQRSSRYL
ncbi:MAG: metallophosphoesterase [Aigarchaeota archaeon]|nr:metallophosphoesterase [Aigarchaeota archaeon]MDW8092140.1 metallophosphoesterase [Nitrososphaerota archaeon]